MARGSDEVTAPILIERLPGGPPPVLRPLYLHPQPWLSLIAMLGGAGAPGSAPTIFAVDEGS